MHTLRFLLQVLVFKLTKLCAPETKICELLDPDPVKIGSKLKRFPPDFKVSDNSNSKSMLSFSSTNFLKICFQYLTFKISYSNDKLR